MDGSEYVRVPFLYEESASIRVFVLYKNSLGGYYYSVTEGTIDWSKAKGLKSYKTTYPLTDIRKYFKTYKSDEFNDIEKFSRKHFRGVWGG